MNSNITNSSISSPEPRLTVVCLCYNQKPYLEEALNSVFKFKSQDTQVIYIDNGSVDGSQKLFHKIKSSYFFDSVILNKENLGSCKAFNQALKLAKGKYIIDFSCDDIILKSLSSRIDFFEKLDNHISLTFSNAQTINESAQNIGYHYSVNAAKKSIDPIPEGQVFSRVLKAYYICTPTMMFRTKTLKDIGGYDERLDYEDFDIKTRLARISEFRYDDQVHIGKRIHNTQMSRGFFSNYRGPGMSNSTLIIFKRLQEEISREEDIDSLCKRCLYEGRNAAIFNYPSKKGFKKILKNHQRWNLMIAIKWNLFSLIGFIIKNKLSKIEK